MKLQDKGLQQNLKAYSKWPNHTAVMKVKLTKKTMSRKWDCTGYILELVLCKSTGLCHNTDSQIKGLITV